VIKISPRTGFYAGFTLYTRFDTCYLIFMSNYKEHAKFNILIALPLLLGGMYYFIHPHPQQLITFSATFIYSTLFMNPDVDLTRQIRLISIRGIITLPFRSYSRIFKHRGLSHHIVLGSFTRIGWLFLWGIIIFYVTYKALPQAKPFFTFYKKYQFYFFYGLAGICLADWGHLFLDRKNR
jgi:uncharacterized metal-binding protein